MIKYPISYIDFNGVEKTEELWFHISKTDVLMAKDNVYNQIVTIAKELQEKAKIIEKIEKETIEKPEEITPNHIIIADAVRLMAKLLDNLFNLSYGKRSDDGSRFIKNEEVLKEWKSSCSYDAMITKMISNPKELTTFVETLMKQ